MSVGEVKKAQRVRYVGKDAKKDECGVQSKWWEGSSIVIQEE